MSSKPNAFQRLIHRFIALSPVTAFFANKIDLMDKFVFRFTKGTHTVSELVGWPIIQLTTTGAKTGLARMSPLIGLLYGEKIGIIASNLGRVYHPGWYYNLKAHPECNVQWNGKSGIYIARQINGDEYERYWQLALSYFEGYEKYKERAGRRIPIMVLEPKDR